VSNRVVFPEFEIYSNPTVKISDIRQRRFNIINRIVESEIDVIVAELRSLDDKGFRTFIVEYVKSHKQFANLRAAVQKVCPEREEKLNMLLVLK